MKMKKIFYVIITISLLVLFCVILYIKTTRNNFLIKESDEVGITELITNAPVTKEERIALEQEYTKNSIEEILSKYEFETEEEKNKFREKFYEHFLEHK